MSKLHRPNFIVSPNEATNKLFNALEKGDIERAKRQVKRSARPNATRNNKNLYNVASSLSGNTRKKAIQMISDMGYNVKSKKRELADKQKRQANFERMERMRLENPRYYNFFMKQRLEHNLRDEEADGWERHQDLLAMQRKPETKRTYYSSPIDGGKRKTRKARQ